MNRKGFITGCNAVGVVGLLLAFSLKHNWPRLGLGGNLALSLLAFLVGGVAAVLGALLAIADGRASAWSSGAIRFVVASSVIVGGTSCSLSVSRRDVARGSAPVV